MVEAYVSLWRIHMNLPKWSAFVTFVCVLFLTSMGIAETDIEPERKELEKLIGQLRENLEGTESLAELSFPEDTSPLFVVKELRISGNSLVSTAKLLEKLPLIYKIYEKDPTTGEDKIDPNTGEKIVKDVYDFRALNEIIIGRGREHKVSLKTIQGLTNYVLSMYREKGYIGIYVYVPKTAVTEGKLEDTILPVEVLEGKVAEIKVERYDFSRQEPNEVYLKESVLKSWSPIKQGEVIQKKELDDFVSLLNLNPDRYISAVVSRSAQPDALNLGYDVYEANPWHWYLQADNAGTKDRQWSPRVGVINTNLTGIDDRFSVMYQAPWEKGIEDEYALFGSYNFPVFTPRLRLNLYSGYSQFDIPAAAGINFLGNGSFYGSMLNYNVFQMDGWFFDITGSLSHERSKVTPSLGLESDVDMDLWGVGINIHRSDDTSNSSLAFIRQKSMGGSSKDDFALARLDTDPDFTIYTTSATHSQYLDTNKVNRLIGSFRWITSDERLVPAKMTTFGGLYSVRGYDEDGIVADGGILISGQYEFDLVKHSESMEGLETGSKEAQVEKPWLRKLAPLAFIDYGRAKIKSPVVGEEEIQELCSIGVGMNVELEDNFNAGIYYGWALRGTDETDRGDGRLSLICKYRF
jgi:hemolysin activation/secretion protein